MYGPLPGWEGGRPGIKLGRCCEGRSETLAPEGLTYERGISNKNFLWLLVEEIGLDAIKAKVKRPLTDLRVGPFYGCYIV